ncbi:MAG: NADH-quinone oxidoreductase subunit NuoB [Candidatus Acidulodesulfobacterium acidiphilum]|uniref:NADH-quinone oxidoreductase subunit NuoB n=1 Tax=Candidatus Acidulodesulfobacterium acidiphilum TaxID=2597224 RepID=A0A520XH14_9DELT|nr:MAG: NADH-quinone oxidoreductase subunit NuoB [Candidatus Acidulodesulfobacterium acidiphilum]
MFFKKLLFKNKTQNIAPESENGSVLIKGDELKRTVDEIFGRSLFVRLVDSGSCNACETELSALSNPYYDLERFGIKFVASPKHADVLIVTGCVTRNMLNPLLKTYENIPSPKFVITAGDCAETGGPFKDSYSVCGPVSKYLNAAVHVKGCPPEPEAVISAFLKFMDILKSGKNS